MAKYASKSRIATKNVIARQRRQRNMVAPHGKTIHDKNGREEVKMELLLWRHADALPGLPDLKRELSAHGRKQARRVASWLIERAPENLRLVVSPATRARQTVSYFCSDEDRMQFCAPLYNGAQPEDILTLLDWPRTSSPALVVGHQPLIGALASWLLGGEPHPSSFRKSALWWLRIGPKYETAQLVQAVDGDMLP
jgi:phosphohistidine phosphatase